MPLKCWQAWGIDHRIIESENQRMVRVGRDLKDHLVPVPVFDQPLGKKVLPDVQSKPSLMQLWTIPMCPVTGYQGGELSLSSPQDTAESCEVTPQSPLLQTWQKQSPQSLLTGHTFQALYQDCCPPLDTFKDLHILLKSWAPALHTVLKVRPHQRWIIPSRPAGHAVFDDPGVQFALRAARAHGRLPLSLLPPSTPRSLSAGLLSSHSSPNLYLCPALLHPRCRIRHLDLLIFIPLIIAQCSNLSRSLCKASCPSRQSLAPPSLVSSTNLFSSLWVRLIEVFFKLRRKLWHLGNKKFRKWWLSFRLRYTSRVVWVPHCYSEVHSSKRISTCWALSSVNFNNILTSLPWTVFMARFHSDEQRNEHPIFHILLFLQKLVLALAAQCL